MIYAREAARRILLRTGRWSAVHAREARPPSDLTLDFFIFFTKNMG
jgi:hypothetical protein